MEFTTLNWLNQAHAECANRKLPLSTKTKMKLLILLSLVALVAAEELLTASNNYGYDFKPKQIEYNSKQAYTTTLKPKIKTWAERFPSMKNLIDTKSTSLPVELRRITNNGYTHYSQSASMQAIEAVDAKNFDAFAAYLADTLQIKAADKRKSFIASLNTIKFSENNDWSIVDIIFDQNKGADCRYACVLGHRDIQRKTYDFLIADFKSSFQLAPDIVLIEERKSYLWGLIQRANVRVERIPAKLKTADVELLKTFFCQAALSRFARMLDIQVPGLPQPFVDPLTVIGLVSAGLDIVPKLINIFKTTSTSTIIKDIAGEGFSRYEQSAKTQVTQGITSANLMGPYLSLLPRLLQLTGPVYEGVEAAIMLGAMAESNTWNDFKIAFNQDKSSTNQVQFVDVVCANRGDEKFNVIVVNVQQVFTLAPNVQYIQNSKSYVGGIYSKTTIERKEYPRQLTDKDLEVLMAFFHITVFKRLAQTYGLPIPQLPDKPPLKN